MSKPLKKAISDIGANSIPALSTNKVYLKPQKGAFLHSGSKKKPKRVPKNSHRKRFMKHRFPYKLPTIVRPKDGKWFVKYFYEIPDRPGEFKEFRVKDGVNYHHDPEQKEIEIQSLRDDIAWSLEHDNYNPFKHERSVSSQIKEKKQKITKDAEAPKNWTLKQGIDAFMDYCRWKELSPNTIRSYQSFLNNFTEWLADTKKLDKPAFEYLETDYIEFADTYYDAEDWSPRTYNNHVSFMITLFSRMQILEKKNNRTLQYQINTADVEYKVDKAEKNRAYSGIVAERVKKELSKPKYAKLNQFIQFIYLSCMRPKEIRLLQIQHIDIQNRQIKVTAPTGKTGDRFVPISNELEKLLIELDFQKLPLNYYLFGKGGKPGEITSGRTWFSDKYKLIKQDLGLDIHIYTMYGWKHTRVLSLIGAGFKDEDIMKLTGHRDYQSYLAYRRDLVVENSVMTGKTMEW